jgi:hypothetical protein
VLCSRVVLARWAAFQGASVGPLAQFGGRAQAHRLALLACRERHQPSASAWPASALFEFCVGVRWLQGS